MLLLSFCHSIEANQETLVDCFLKTIACYGMGPAQNLYILVAEVDMITVYGTTFANQWE